jgi:hypothetical protein
MLVIVGVVLVAAVTTVKLLEEVAEPAGAVTWIGPDVAPTGTVAAS